MKIIILFCLLFISCEEDSADIKKSNTPKIIWKKQLGPILNDQISFDPILYKNDLLFGYQTNTTEGYFRYNKESGEVVNKYENIGSFDFDSYLIDNIYFSTNGSKARSLNLQTNKIDNFLITNEANSSSVYVTTHDQSLFLSESGNFNFTKTYPLNQYKIVRAFKDKLPSWDLIWSNEYKIEDGIFGVDIKYLIVEKNDNGAEIIYFPSQLAFHDVRKPSKYKLEAVNITENKLLWQTKPFQVDSFNSHGLSNFPPIIFGNLIIAGISGRHLHAFDKLTGNKVWENYFKDALLTTKMVLYQGKLSILDNIGNLFLIDAKTGNILSKKNLIAGNTENWALNKGKIYFTTATGKLYGVDANNHNIEWEIKSPNQDNCSYCSFFNASPVVDPETNRLYISDRKDVICYQL